VAGLGSSTVSPISLRTQRIWFEEIKRASSLRTTHRPWRGEGRGCFRGSAYLLRYADKQAQEQIMTN
jgi:hypothetical protein